ncbi:PfkB family carbohydrate kinase [Compostibacter hankyongensis]|uniref:Carbohydrate kinase n=1 Tax=Compostibacter hankyongensis TaxID=1007089 RepID=A0ABP8G4S2_9BACT
MKNQPQAGNGIICFGEVLWDQLPSGPVPGGAPMNVAYHLRQLGRDARMASRTGRDERGEKLTGFLREKGLWSPLMQEDEKLPTCLVEVWQDSAGDTRYRIPEPVSWDAIRLTPALQSAAGKAAAVVYGTLANRDAHSRNALLGALSSAPEALKIMDVNIREPHYDTATMMPLFRMADMLKLNAEEYARIAGDLGLPPSPETGLEALAAALDCKAICLTLGAAGALFWQEGRFFRQPGAPVDVADTIGAGDAFLAGFIHGYLLGIDPAAALQAGILLGGYVAGKAGACPPYETFLWPALRKVLQQ